MNEPERYKAKLVEVPVKTEDLTLSKEEIEFLVLICEEEDKEDE